jgi:hypothetical protein
MPRGARIDKQSAALARYNYGMPAVEQNDRDAARIRFLAACSRTGASTMAYRGVDGCWLDAARIGAADARAVLILSCGLQGAEGYCGSGILTHWLNQGLQRAAPRGTALVLIHTIVPAGMSAVGVGAPDDAAGRDWNDTVLQAASHRFARYARAKGLTKEAPPPAPGGAGERATWLADAFKAVAQNVAAHGGPVGLIEFHTSLRPFGEVAVTSPHLAGGAADRRVMEWFGDAAGARAGGPASLDCFALGFGEHLTPDTLTAAHVDFGVYSMPSILRLEARSSVAERRADIDGLFFPSSQAWRKTVRESAADIIDRALQGLAKS